MAEASPRLVHVVWLGSDVPSQVLRLRDEVQRHSPHVEVRIWRDGDLEWLTHHAELLTEPRMSGKANIARYELLLVHGGMYLDADMRVHRSLEPVFAATDRHGLVVARQSPTVYNPAFVAAAPRHPALRRAVDGIPETTRRFAAMTSPARTGPHYFTSVLRAHVRSGGAFHELPQHAVYPWYADEDPLPDRLLPPSVVMSHEWAALSDTWADPDARTDGGTVAVPDRRSRLRRSGGTVRARAAATPAAHRLIGELDRVRAGRARDRNRVARPPDSPTSTLLDAWTARRAARDLRGSAVLLDLHPSSLDAAMSAARALDRPGRVIVVADEHDPLPPAWDDPSMRCTRHLVTCDPTDADTVAGIRTWGTPLVARDVSGHEPPTGSWHDRPGPGLAELIDGVPRFDLVRVRAARLTPAVAATVTAMTSARRIARLVVELDPFATGGGVDLAVAGLAELEAAGLGTRLAPWLIDGRGRTWREQFRVAGRPFLVVVPG